MYPYHPPPPFLTFVRKKWLFLKNFVYQGLASLVNDHLFSLNTFTGYVSYIKSPIISFQGITIYIVCCCQVLDHKHWRLVNLLKNLQKIWKDWSSGSTYACSGVIVCSVTIFALLSLTSSRLFSISSTFSLRSASCLAFSSLEISILEYKYENY